MSIVPDTSYASMPIGMNARLFPSNWRPARQEIAFAAEHDFACLQFPGEEQGLGEARLGAPMEEIGTALTSASIGAVMEIVVRLDRDGRTGTGKTPLAVLEANRLAIAALGCAAVHLHIAPLERMDRDALQAVEAGVVPDLRAGVAIAERDGFRLGVEHNEPWLPIFATPERCAWLLNAVPRLGFVWDLNHTPLDQLDGYLRLAPRMQLLHVADTPLPEVNHHLPLGEGTIDFVAYLAALRDADVRVPAILEIGGLPRSGGYGRDTDDALIDSRRQLAEAIESVQLLFSSYDATGSP